MIDINKLYIQVFGVGRQKMPNFFYQRENEQATNATLSLSLYIYIYITHKVSDKIVLIFKKTITIY